MATSTTVGKVERTPRGFRQDIELAMGADPTRAIVELVTNADDAYVHMPHLTKGKIRIEIQRRRGDPTTIAIHDRARGMTRPEMQDRLAREGARTSGFEHGIDARGLLGRGAKDIVHFGPATWQSYKDGERTRFSLLYSGGATGQYEIESLGKADPKKHGTSVSLDVQPRFTIKQHEPLAQLLARHYALRPCLSDREGRDVRLVDRNRDDRDDHLVYEYPTGEPLATKKRIAISGYEGKYVEVTLSQAAEFLDDDGGREYWRHSLLVKSGRAAYENFAGKFIREPWSLLLPWFFGVADVPGINELIREYDEREEGGLDPTSSNPIRLVKRNRQGLVPRDEHPFVNAMYEALEGFLQPFLQARRDELETKSHTPETDETKKRLRDISRALGSFLEEQEDESSDIEGAPGILPPLGLSLVPTAQRVDPGEMARVTVTFRPHARDQESSPTAQIVSANALGSLSANELRLEERGGYSSKTFQVTNLPEGEIAEVAVTVGEQTETCLIESCKPNRPPVYALQFQSSAYSVREGGQRKILLFAPWDAVAEVNRAPVVRLRGSGSGVVLNGSVSKFGYHSRFGCGCAVIRMKGRQIGAQATMVAEFGGETAEADITVVAGGEGGVEVRLVDEELGQRGVWEGSTLKISARHSSVQRYLGKKSDNWPGQHSIHFRTMLAEIIAFEGTRRVIQNRNDGQLPLDALSLYHAHILLSEKCLKQIHSVSVCSAEAQMELSKVPDAYRS